MTNGPRRVVLITGASSGIGPATLLSWLRRLLPARLFEPSPRKAFVLERSSKGTAVTRRRTQP